jgi:ABC-type amino acid transport substrate-binding protein
MDTIIDEPTAAANHLRLSRPYNVSGVAIALKPGLAGIASYGDLKGKGLRVGAIVGSVASVTLGQQGLRTIPFAFEDEMLDSLGKGELDAALVTPTSAGYYNLVHKDARLIFVRAFEAMPEFRWSLAVGMRKADDALVAAVNQALERMLADGTVNRIYAGYGIEQHLPQP